MSGVYRLNRTNNVIGRLNKLFEAASEDYWWLAGGISAANCIAAYQPIGAADYATSKINLANPGTYDAYEGTAPDWDAINGWDFNGTDDILYTGLIPVNNQNWSMIARFDSAILNKRYLAGCWTDPCGFNGQYAKIGNDSENGVMAVAGANAFYNGVDIGNIGSTSGEHTNPITLGSNGSVFFDGRIQALTIYNIDISAYVAELTTAMNAL